MSREEVIQKTTKNYYDLLQFLKDNPDILNRWKSKIAGVDETPADETTDADIPRNQLRDDYRDR